MKPFELPKLEGTYRQARWAQDIRRSYLEHAIWLKGEGKEAESNIILDYLKKEASAEFWIRLSKS